MKRLRIFCLSLSVALLASACGEDKKITLPNLNNPPAERVAVPTSLPVGGEWNAELVKENRDTKQPSVKAKITFYSNQIEEKTTCSLNGYWVSASVTVPATVDEKNFTVLAGNTFSNPLKIDDQKTFPCTAQLPQGTFPYDISGNTLTIHSPIAGQGALTFTR